MKSKVKHGLHEAQRGFLIGMGVQSGRDEAEGYVWTARSTTMGFFFKLVWAGSG